MTQTKPVYMGEAQLVRWSHSAEAGRTVTLRIDEHTAVHPFNGLKYGGNGQRMQIVCVPVDDNEEPIQPEQAKAKRREPVQNGRRVLSSLAHLKCHQDEAFQVWFCATFRDELTGMSFKANEPTGDYCDRGLKFVLGIKSKTILDAPGSPEGERFERIMTDFDMRDMVR